MAETDGFDPVMDKFNFDTEKPNDMFDETIREDLEEKDKTGAAVEDENKSFL